MYGLLGICLCSCEDRYTLPMVPCMHTHADSDDNHDKHLKQVSLSLSLSLSLSQYM